MQDPVYSPIPRELIMVNISIMKKWELANYVATALGDLPGDFEQLKKETLHSMARDIKEQVGAASCLPKSWRQGSKQELLDLLEEHLKYGTRQMAIAKTMNKPEIMMILADYEQEMKTTANASQIIIPKCPACRLFMVKRRNRETLEEFYGCTAYPACRESYSVEQAKRITLKQMSSATSVNQKKVNRYETTTTSRASEGGEMPSTSSNSQGKRSSQGTMRRKMEGKAMTRHGTMESDFIKVGNDGKTNSSDISDLED